MHIGNRPLGRLRRTWIDTRILEKENVVVWTGESGLG
jgi:hypothetical protein